MLQLYELPWASLVSHVSDVTSIRGCKKYEDIDTGKQDVGGNLSALGL